MSVEKLVYLKVRVLGPRIFAEACSNRYKELAKLLDYLDKRIKASKSK